MLSTHEHPKTMETTPTRSFERTVLPWLVAAVMLLVYLATLNKVVTVQSIWPLARAAGMDWHPTYTSPLTYLVMLPIRWLPAGIQLLALNFSAALFASVSLGLLARSIAILPHDRTQLQRDRAIDENAFLRIRLAWIPVGFGIAVLAFQRSFWEHAIVGTGEALDLLLFAYCVRCLLEYRLEEKNAWLYKAALVYGVGITNNVAMIGFFPVFLIALVWIKGLRFFRFDFLSRMFLLGLAGLSLYLVLPLVENHAGATFWQALRTNLVWQKHLAFDFRNVVLFPAVYALVPLLLIGIKWSGNFGDQSAIGNIFAKAAAIVLHAGLLVFCVYIAFDPPVGPRESAARAFENFGINFVFLPCYFLAALTVGYYSGFLLLVFSGTENRMRRRTAIPPVLNYAVTFVVSAGALVVAGKLFYDNFRGVQQMQSRSLFEYSEAQAKSLPENAAVLSDDPSRLHAFAAALGTAARQKVILLEARALTDPAYHRFIRKRYGTRVPEMKLPPGFTAFGPLPVVDFLNQLRQKHELIYLHPSYGYFFEFYYQEPREAVYTLKPFPADSVEAPLPGQEVITRQQNFWKTMESPLHRLKAELAVVPRERNSYQKLTSVYAGGLYSRALNHWGVELQRAKRFEEAFPHFEQAVALNPDSAAALINRDFNVAWRKENKPLLSMSKEHEEKLKLYNGVDALLTACGPVDEPSFSREFANHFVSMGLYRQAQQLLLRGLTYLPNDAATQIALANTYLSAEQPRSALELLEKMAPPARDDHAAIADRERIRAWATYLQNDFPTAQKILEKAARDFPELNDPFTALVQLHLAYGQKLREEGKNTEAAMQLTNALHVVEGQLRVQPNNPSAHFNHGNCCIFVGDNNCAIQSFTRVLELQKDNGAALLNRAIASFRAENFTAAKRDYQEVLRRFTITNYQVYYGLAEIAYREKDWPAAREYYEKYLRYAPANLTGERNQVRAKLEEVKKNSKG